jgi:hypothetical protein
VLCRLRLPRFFPLQPAAATGFFESVAAHMSLHGDATPYHNFWHAVDVMQTVNSLLVQMNAAKLFTPVETLALVIGALCHDLEHPGVNNAYLMNSGAELALRYNDVSVLESHHAAVASSLLAKHKLLEGLSKGQHKEFRKVMIAGILATDMTCHFSLTDELKSVGLANASRIRYLLGSTTAFHHRPPLRDAAGNVTPSHAASITASQTDDGSTSAAAGLGAGLPGSAEELADISSGDRLIMLKNVLHAADISNPTKPWALCKIWSDRVLLEFFAQGDRERREGLPLSPNTDRATVKQSQMSVNFIDFVVAPLFIALSAMLPGAQLCVDLLNENRTAWSDRLKAEIEGDAALGSAGAKEEAKRKWERRDTVFNRVMMPLVQEAAGGGAAAPGAAGSAGGDSGSSPAAKGDGSDDGWGDDGEAEEVAATARLLSLNALETFVSAAAANSAPAGK